MLAPLDADADLTQHFTQHRQSLLDEGSQALRATLNELTTNMLQLAACVKNLNQAVGVGLVFACGGSIGLYRSAGTVLRLGLCLTAVLVPSPYPLQVQVADRYERDRKRRVKERTDRGEWGVQGGAWP